MGAKNYLRIVGVIENMSEFVAPDGSRHPLFGEGGGQQLADDIGAPLLGRVPIEPAVSVNGDQGDPLRSARHRRPSSSGRSPGARRGVVPPVEMAGCSARMLDAAMAALDALDENESSTEPAERRRNPPRHRRRSALEFGRIFRAVVVGIADIDDVAGASPPGKPGPPKPAPDAPPKPGPVTVMRDPKRAMRTVRMIAREGGSRHSRPTASVTKPGVSIKAPAIATSKPSSSSLAGNSPALTRFWKRKSKPSPSRRTRKAAAAEIRIIKAIALTPPTTCAAWIRTQISKIGTTRKRMARMRNTPSA